MQMRLHGFETQCEAQWLTGHVVATLWAVISSRAWN